MGPWSAFLPEWNAEATDRFAPENFHHQPDVPGYGQLVKSIAETDAARVQFLKACLAKLGLEVSLEASAVPSLSKLHLSALSSSDVPKLVQSLAAVVTKEDGEDYIKGENDLFHLEKPDSRWDLRALSQALTIEYDKPEERQSPRGTPDPASEYHKVPKSIVSHLVSWPGPRETPSFNHALFYSSLQEYRSQEKDARSWGDTLLYGEVVTSTNTLLEKYVPLHQPPRPRAHRLTLTPWDRNITLLSKLPTGFTLTATTQVTGRGRGSNVWVSPAGSLIMSTVINHPADLATSRPIVFIQYLTAIAIVEAIQSYDDGFEGLPVKLKWPNDIYALDPTSEAATQPARARARAPPSAYVKIGGILANCAYSAGSYQVVLGIGLNANNGRPTTSLDALLPLLSAGAPKPRPAPFRIERLVARILTRLEALYGDFCRDGFAPRLERRYYGHWLHTDQIVTLEAEGGVRARVLGITPDWGLLRAEEVREDGIDGALRGSGRLWALQSDENSFDFWKGLVKRKL